MPRPTADGWLPMASYGVRLFAYGFLAVVLALHLREPGLSAGMIGVVFAVALAGGAVCTPLAAEPTLAAPVGAIRPAGRHVGPFCLSSRPCEPEATGHDQRTAAFALQRRRIPDERPRRARR